MWDLVSHVKYFQHSPSHVSHIIPGTTFGSDTILGRDNSSHNFHRGPLVWTRETRELEPTNPQFKNGIRANGSINNLKMVGSKRMAFLP